MKNFWKDKGFGIVYGIVLTAFSVYVLLDSFVITRNYGTAALSNREEMMAQYRTEGGSSSSTSGGGSGENSSRNSASENEDGSSENNGGDGASKNDDSSTSGDGSDENRSENGSGKSEEDASPIITDTSYKDGNISIEITRYRKYDTEIYVADVKLSSPEYLKTALADDTYGHNIKAVTSEIAAAHGAILAIDGDYYGVRNDGYVIREGVLYRSERTRDAQALAIMVDGSFRIVEEDEVTAEELLDAGAVNVLSFGPGLVQDGQVSVTEGEEVARSLASNPRAAIGVIDGLHYVFVVSDGRTDESAGLSLYQLGCFMQEIGVSTGYNLDGGGSATLYFNGRVINKPTSDGRSFKERRVSDIVYIGY